MTWLPREPLNLRVALQTSGMWGGVAEVRGPWFDDYLNLFLERYATLAHVNGDGFRWWKLMEK